MAKSSGKPRPESVQLLLELATDALRDERERGRQLDAKTGALATFSGAILVLDVTLGRQVLTEDFGDVAEIILPICFLLAAVALLVASALSVFGVLRPQSYLALKSSQVRRFARYPLVTQDETRIRGNLLLTVGDNLLPRERSRNNRKVKLVKAAAVSLLIGLIGVAGQALTLGIVQLA
jgi:hypothetical protein